MKAKQLIKKVIQPIKLEIVMVESMSLIAYPDHMGTLYFFNSYICVN